MLNSVESVTTNLAQKLVDGAIKEVQYLCCFNGYLENFEIEKKRLSAKRREVQKDIDDAKKRNEIHIEDGVKQWADEAESLINQKDPKAKKKWFYGWCPNCIWQYKQGKKLAKMTEYATNLLKRCDFNKVARPAELPGINYHTSQDFIDFESRKSKFKELMMALEDGNYYMIGLQGMAGTGKTTLATQVGKQVEESKAFQKVIFTVVSTPPNIKKIQGDIARQLGLPLEQKRTVENSELLWSKITENLEKILIILDDVWEKLNLRDIGIPSSNEHRKCCVLITTRNSNVCGAMGCQRTIRLETLNDKDALNLFLIHAISNDNLYSSDSERMALDIVKKCGGLPVVIVALANTLRNWPTGEWKLALTTIRNSEALDDVDEDLMEVYNCLSLSYENLRNEKAKKLFLLCSLFPENYEIPINLFIRLGIGAGIFGDVDKYYKSKRQALGVKNELIASSLLKVEKECVKMHDLVRDMALRISKEDIQVIMGSRISLKANKRFLFWDANDFPDQFDGTVLEILFLLINGKVLKKSPDAFFAGMTMLRVLFLRCNYDKKHLPPLLSQSLLSLKNIRSVILNGWILDDLSFLRSLQSLETLELENCLIVELPIEIRELNKLRLLGLRKCKIERHNPFEVIKRCTQLEELYFVENDNVEDWKAEIGKRNIDVIAHDTSPPELQMYFIACSGLDYFEEVDNGLLKCFNTKHVRNFISDAMFKHLVGRAEVLEFGEIKEKGWKSLVPDLVPMKDGSLNDLLKLCLYYLDDMECLIDTSKNQDSEVIVFSKLVELHLYHVNVKELCQGPLPSNFLKQLQILILRDCGKLHNIFFDGNLIPPHLKTLELQECPMFQPSLFQPSVARSLAQLEELIIIECERLKSIITYESSKEEIKDVNRQKGLGILFPKLRSLRIDTCGELEWISPLLFAGDLPSLEAIIIRKCMKLEYIFGEYRDDEGQVLKQDIMLPSLTEMEVDEAPKLISIFRECDKSKLMLSPVVKGDSKEKHTNFKICTFPRFHGCRFLPTTKDINTVVSNDVLRHHANSQGLCASMKGIETFHRAECLLRQPLNLQNIRVMNLYYCSNLKSLFSVSIATTIMLEKLKIACCDELKHIISNEEEDRDDHINYGSIFPKLEEINIRNCRKLEFLFPSTCSGGLEKLKSIDIEGAYALKYVFGGYNNRQNNVRPIDLPALEILSLIRVPKIISMCAKNYYLVWPSLQNITLTSCQELMIRPFPNLMVGLQGRQLKLETVYQELIRRPFTDFRVCLQGQSKLETRDEDLKKIMKLMSLEVGNSEEIKEIFNLEGIEGEEPVTLSLQVMRLKYLRELRYIYKDPHNILSLRNLEVLVINGCDKLRAIFSTSTLKSLPRLSYLEVIDCRELLHIIEEDDDYGRSGGDDRSHRPYCFPMLEQIRIYYCYNLRSLFSISTCGMLPKLEMLEIEAASSLEEVFKCQQDDDVMENVVPNLSYLRLIDLPKLRTICGSIDFQSVPNFEVFYCPRYTGETVELQSTHSDVDRDSENQEATEELQSVPDLEEEARKKIIEVPISNIPAKVPSSSSSGSAFLSMEETLIGRRRGSWKRKGNAILLRGQKRGIRKSKARRTQDRRENVTKDPTATLKAQAIETSLDKLQSRKPALHELEDEQSTSEPVEVPHNQRYHGETNISSTEVPHKTNIPFDDYCIDAIVNERLQEDFTSDDVLVATLFADLAPRNSSSRELITSLKEEFFPDLTKKESSESILTNQEALGEMASDSVESIQEDTKTMNASLFHSQAESSQLGPSTMTITETKDASVSEGLESEKGTKANLLDGIPSLHSESHIVVAGPSTILGIGEILELVDLKDGEPALLVKAIELYPQLRLSREHRPGPIIAFSYRVLIDILVLLATKTPCTITTSERSSLEANLDAAMFFGFDRDWVESVRTKVFGINVSDVLAIKKEEILTMEAELEACDIALEHVRKERAEAKEHLATVERHLGMAQSMFESIDSRLSGLLEHRQRFIIKIKELRDIISANNTPFGF